MNWLNKLERKFGRFYISNLMIYVCITMLAVYLMQYLLGFNIIPWMDLYRPALFQGQVWRLITFIFVPPNTSVLFILLSLYFYYMVGSSLESAWGGFRFNVYYLVGMVGIIIASLITGYGNSTYLNLSLFLAFAQLFPDTEFLLFFLIPVKAKYLAYVDWAIFAVGILFGSWPSRIAAVMSLLNFFLFFGPGIFKKMKDNRKYSAQRKAFRQAMNDTQNKNFH